jgi:hypothetical protein
VKIRYIGSDGRIRRSYDNVNSMWQRDGNEIVTINRKVEWVYATEVYPLATATATWTPPLNPYSQEYAIAILHLGPGEYTEIVDEPTGN